MQYQLIKSILSAYWHINPDALDALSPMVLNVLDGKQANIKREELNIVSYEENIQSRAYGSSVASSGREVVVFPVRGVLTKSDTLCDYGMESMNNILKNILNSENVAGVVLDMDTPGGEASYMPILQQTIKNSKKPIIAYYNSMCASAGYGLASQCREIYASTDTDTVGSIGTMVSWYDFKAWMEKEGIKLEERYATRSTNKNAFWRLRGTEQGEALIKAELDQFNNAFIASVAAARDIKDDEVYTGKTYKSTQAITNGLIDGIKSLEDCVMRVFDLVDAPSTTQNSKSNTNMSKHVQTVASFLGYTGLEAKDGHISLCQEDVEKIGAALDSGQSAATQLEAAQVQEAAQTASINAINDTLGKIQGTLATIQANQTQMSDRLNAVESVVPGAAPASAVAPDANAEEAELEAWENPNHPLNANIGNFQTR
jgi:protease-4